MIVADLLTCTISQDGQLTLPKHLRDSMHAGPGTTLVIDPVPNGFRLTALPTGTPQIVAFNGRTEAFAVITRDPESQQAIAWPGVSEKTLRFLDVAEIVMVRAKREPCVWFDVQWGGEATEGPTDVGSYRLWEPLPDF